ncbi:MAG: glycosidase [Marinilabiliales bacterium]|nr:MAG: glycosidase [Marinilabiliales bacterium]
MQEKGFETRLKELYERYRELVERKNEPLDEYNGLFTRYRYPVLTAGHIPVFWKYDLDPGRNPLLIQRFGINSVFNAGAIRHEGKVLLVARVEGYDRKSFFAVAESSDGINGFRFWDRPVVLPPAHPDETNVYDMRLTRHEDGWIYGLFCAERKDPSVPASDTSSALAACGIARTRDLKEWERLPDLETASAQQRNVVLHPEFIDGKYALYTRPQDSFIEAGSGGGIGWALTESMESAGIDEEKIVDGRVYHTIKESKNGQGPAPIKTDKGWLHLAHGVRMCAAGLRYVLYVFMTGLNDPSEVTHRPAGYFLAPEYEERVGDVSNVVFSNGWVEMDGGRVLIYYGSSDTRMHVAETTVDRLVDYAVNTPEDSLTSAGNVEILNGIIDRNMTVV